MDIAKLIERAKNICLTPKTEWPKIADEPADVMSLYTGYAMILAAIPAVAGFIGMSVVGMSLPIIGTIRIGMIEGLTQMILSYALGLGMIFVLSLIIDALASTFDGQKNPIAALKLAIYSYTPFWLAGILMIIPALGLLTILAALYSIYLLYTGLPSLMKNPPEKSIGYTALIVVCAIVLGLVLGALVALVGGGGIGMRAL
jgi:Yip1 domain